MDVAVVGTRLRHRHRLSRTRPPWTMVQLTIVTHTQSKDTWMNNEMLVVVDGANRIGMGRRACVRRDSHIDCRTIEGMFVDAWPTMRTTERWW